MHQPDQMLFSVVIPVRDGGELFRNCLAALAQSTFTAYELIVVDDRSADDSAIVAATHGALVLQTGAGSGPAHARNVGAQAAGGSYLFFIDADCAVHPDTLARAAERVTADPGLAALFGSYDDAPAAGDVLSLYKNLQHHYIHQTSSARASTFWTGCGVVRRDLFLALGGFDAQRYPRPSIEDIEFGYRMTAAGLRIELAKEVQVKHLKRWTWRSWLSADILHRAVPWTMLMLERDAINADLNLQWRQRISGGGAVTLIFALLYRPVRRFAPGIAAALLWLNADFYRFLWRKRGWRLMLVAIPLHWLFFVYSTLTFACVYLLLKMKSHIFPNDGNDT